MFKIIHDLSKLSKEEVSQYCRDYSTYLGLNPDENRIDTIWMNTETVRALVAYCRRGTTDLLRDIYGIDIVELKKEDGPNYVSFTAKGTNRRGRQEIAVGAYTTTGLSGDRLAAAVATAQTRALRRLTLQFIGGGLLDESEVNNQTVDTTATIYVPTLITPPAVQPKVAVNPEIGKPVEAPAAFSSGDIIPNNLEKLPEVKKASPQPSVKSSVDTVNEILEAQTIEPEPQKLEKKRRGRPRKVDMGDVVSPEKAVSDNVETPKNSETVKSASADIPESQRSTTQIPICPDCNGPMEAEERMDVYLCRVHGKADTTTKPSVIKALLPKPELPVPETRPVEPPKTISPLTEEEQKKIKERMAPYWIDILPKGGMTADDGISVWGKLIKYANLYFVDAPDYKKWTLDKWHGFLSHLDKTVAEQGEKGLVSAINERIKS